MNEQTINELLKSFLDGEGKLTKYPSKFKLKIISLFYLATKFEPNKKYTEKEVNEVLNEWHTFKDWTTLRRYLYDGRFLNREKDGSLYWLESNQPELKDFNL